VNPVRLCKLILVDLTYRVFDWVIVPWLQLMHLKSPQLEKNPTIELSLTKNDMFDHLGLNKAFHKLWLI
jgi:hypothetical protein